MTQTLKKTETKLQGSISGVSSTSFGLQRAVLSPLETLAQSIAGIAPSATPGMLIPIVFGFAGNGTWLSYLLATIGILFTAQCINEFASRSSSPGSLYTFVSQGLGTKAGTLTGWALLFAYIFCGAACVTEFAIYAISLTKHFMHIQLSGEFMMTAAALLVGFIACSNIKLSAKLMLVLELLSVGLILVLVAVALFPHGKSFVIDPNQIRLSSVSFENVRMGLVMAIFGFVAFESAASLGSEAKDPLTSVPKAITNSVIFSGLFFILTSYAMVLCFGRSHVALGQCSTPLLTMSQLVGLPAIGHALDAGVMMSFFAAGVANLNAGARIIYKMSLDGYAHRHLSKTHSTNHTPHIAVMIISCISLGIALLLAAAKVPLMEIVGCLGTLATFGFIFAYLATSVSAAILLKRINRFGPIKMFVVACSMGVLSFALVGSLYPAPPHPYNLLPFGFAAYMALGCVCVGRLQRNVIE